MKYRVFLETTVGHYLDVEADSPEEAEEDALLEGLPGLMFLDHTYPDEGEWDVAAVDELDEA